MRQRLRVLVVIALALLIAGALFIAFHYLPGSTHCTSLSYLPQQGCDEGGQQ